MFMGYTLFLWVTEGQQGEGGVKVIMRLYKSSALFNTSLGDGVICHLFPPPKKTLRGN